MNKLLLALTGLLAFNAAVAEVDEESSAPAVRFEGGTVYPGFAVRLKNDSNILRLSETNPSKMSSKIAVLSPFVIFQAQRDANDYSLAYSADIGRYNSSPADNYVDQKLLGRAKLEFSLRSSLIIQPEVLIGHDDRGSTFGLSTAVPSTWHSAGLNGSFAYGAEEARGKAVLDVDYTDLQYQNNRFLTFAYDRKLSSVGGTFYLRVQPQTFVLVHARHTGIAYQQIGSVLDSQEDRYMLGVKWDASAQTSGEVKAGQLHKRFDSSLQPYSGGSWEGTVRWSPVSYVKVDIFSSKKSYETTLAGSRAILTSNTGANVSFDVNDRVTLHANGSQFKEDFAGVSRIDHTNTVTLKADYKFRSWLIGGAEYTNNAKTSNSPLNEYKRNIFMFSLNSVL